MHKMGDFAVVDVRTADTRLWEHAPFTFFEIYSPTMARVTYFAQKVSTTVNVRTYDRNPDVSDVENPSRLRLGNYPFNFCRSQREEMLYVHRHLVSGLNRTHPDSNHPALPRFDFARQFAYPAHF